MVSGNNYQYYVEGENERRLVEVLKKLKYIKSGKIQVFNVVQETIKETHTMVLDDNTTVILVFDTDTGNIGKLKDNIEFLKKRPNIKEVLCIPQVHNIEEELVRSCCNINNIKDLLGSKSHKEFKSDFNKNKDIDKHLKKAGFDFKKLWRKETDGVFSDIKCILSKIENMKE